MHEESHQAAFVNLLGWLISVLALILVCSGCDSTTTGVGTIIPTGQLVNMSECKGWPPEGDKEEVPSDQDCIQYTYVGRNLLLLRHINAGFNCCPRIEAHIYVQGRTIFIVEHELEGNCRCLCLFDLDYEVRNLEPGVYRVMVSQEYLEPGDQPLHFTINLLTSPSGTHCVKRQHYPWGL